MGTVNGQKTRALPDYPRGITFEQVWAALMEDRERQQERQKELDLALKETDRIVKDGAKQHEELKKVLHENAKRQEERSKRLDEQLGNLGNRYGEMIEYMVKPNLVNKFRELGFEFTKAHQDTSIKDTRNNIFLQVDFTLEDGDTVMIVEVKSKPSVKDVKDHIERMGKYGVTRSCTKTHGNTLARWPGWS